MEVYATKVMIRVETISLVDSRDVMIDIVHWCATFRKSDVTGTHTIATRLESITVSFLCVSYIVS